MQLEKAFFTDKYGEKLFLYKCFPEGKPKAVVQVVHGMAEHAGRYERFAKYLTACGIAVYADDHRGHGYTVKDGKSWGVLADEDGFTKMVEDEKEITDLIRKEFPTIPVILLGHSMGSFICRHYAAKYGNSVEGLILSGTGSYTYIELISGLLISLLQCKLYGKKSPARFLDNLIFGGYNKVFTPNRTAFDWLSRDEQEVDKFIDDPMCGNVFPVGFYADFFQALMFFKREKSVNKIPENLPVFILSGGKDPVGGLGKGTQMVYQQYKKRGIKDLRITLYPGGRHEMLNEINKLEVTEDICRWIEKQCGSKSILLESAFLSD